MICSVLLLRAQEILRLRYTVKQASSPPNSLEVGITVQIAPKPYLLSFYYEQKLISALSTKSQPPISPAH